MYTVYEPFLQPYEVPLLTTPTRTPSTIRAPPLSPLHTAPSGLVAHMVEGVKTGLLLHSSLLRISILRLFRTLLEKPLPSSPHPETVAVLPVKSSSTSGRQAGEKVERGTLAPSFTRARSLALVLTLYSSWRITSETGTFLALVVSFLLSWTPRNREREVAFTGPSASSSYTQCAAVMAQLDPTRVAEQWLLIG